MSESSARRTPGHLPDGRVAVVGRGRMGRALVSALAAAGVDVVGPLPRGATAEGARVLVLAVPDAAIAAAARLIAPGPIVGHLSGALGLDPLASHEGFSLHPLTSVTTRGADFGGVFAAVDASTPAAERVAFGLAKALGLTPFHVERADRAAYHAAASIASNFLVALEVLAEDLAATAAVPREALVPLVRTTVENWAEQGAAALTGPVARGDIDTVARHREALAARLPDSLALYDALAAATADIASRTPPEETTP